MYTPLIFSLLLDGLVPVNALNLARFHQAVPVCLTHNINQIL